MKSSKANIAIAKICGWRQVPISSEVRAKYGTPEKLMWKKGRKEDLWPPNYTRDLNECCIMETTLTGGMRSKYDAELGLIATRDHCFIWETSAKQRAEAFLHAHNAWTL